MPDAARPLPHGLLEVEVTSTSHRGEGVGRLPEAAGDAAGKAVFVPGALPHERVRVRVVEHRRRWARAELVEVLGASPGRVRPPCPVADTCGGCDLQHVDPDHQRTLKRQVVHDQLVRIGRVPSPPVADCLPVGPDLGYRTHATVHRHDTLDAVGFRRRGSHDVVPITTCPVLHPRVDALLGPAATSGAADVGLHAGDATTALLLTPGPGPLELPPGPDHLLATQPDGTAVALRGDGALVTTVPTIDGPLVLGHDPTCFFQASAGAAGAIVDHVVARAGVLEGAVCWDLYAGVGLLSIALARRGAAVTAVEGHAAAAEWAARNATADGVDLAVVTEDVRAFVGRDHADDPPDVVVLDPPRTGAGEQVMRHLAALGPAAVVVVACDAGALARDTRTLADAGYDLRAAQPLDCFPMTHHVEVVALYTP